MKIPLDAVSGLAVRLWPHSYSEAVSLKKMILIDDISDDKVRHM